MGHPMSPVHFSAAQPCRPAGLLRLGARLLLIMGAVLGTGAVLAADADSADEAEELRLTAPALAGIAAAAPGWRVSHSAVPLWVSAGAAGLTGVSPVHIAQSMVWTARPLLQLGLGIERRWSPPSGPGAAAPIPSDAALLVGLRLDTGPFAHWSWQAPLWRQDASNGDVQARQMRVALVLTPQDPYADLRRGLLTELELSGQTTLALRPRGGRIGLLLTSRW